MIPTTPNAELRIQIKMITDAISGNAQGAVSKALTPPRPLNLLFTSIAVSKPAPTEKMTFKVA